MKKTHLIPPPSQQQQQQLAIAWSYPDYTSNLYQQPNNSSHADYSIHPLDNEHPTTSMTTTLSPEAASDQFAPSGIHNYRRNAAIGVMTITQPMDIPLWSPPSSHHHLDNSVQARQLVRPATCPDTFPSLSSSNFTVGSIPEPPPPWPFNMQAVQTPMDEKNMSTPQGTTPDEDEMLVFNMEDLTV